MSTLNMRRALSGIALAAIAQVSCAANDIASETQVVGLTQASQFAPAPSIAEVRRAGRGSPVTLYLEDSSGNAFQLVHIQGTGWRYGEGWKSADKAASSPLRKVASLSTESARPQEGAIPDGEPLTVFIDGPSGYTFVWEREGGWKFVGKMVDKSQ